MRFTEALRKRAQSGYIPVIPDFKMISPASGELFSGRDVLKVAKEMELAGAPVLSVVTEKQAFGGSPELLMEIAETVDIPILRKDFVHNRRDIEETARMGASAVLLICACMSEGKLRELYHASLELGIEPLVEIHSEEEMKLAASMGAGLIGINNRDILNLERDGGTVYTTAKLAAGKPEGAFLVSESGICGKTEVQIALESGADAVLVGTAIWKAEAPIAFYKELARK